MRAAARVLVLVALLAALGSVVTGLLISRQADPTRVTTGSSAEIVAHVMSSPPHVLHAVAGGACLAAASLAGAAALLLGLHGLLEPRGRRVVPALLLAVSPVLMGSAVTVLVTGLAVLSRGRAEASTPRFLQLHAMVFTAVLLVALGVFGVVATTGLRQRRSEDEDDDDER